MKNQVFGRRLGYAWAGLRTAALTEYSLRTQLAFAVFAVLALLLFRPEPLWWAIVLVTVVMVLSAEMMNTAFEALCDLVEPNQHPQIKKAKDIAAGAVLLTSVGAVVVAVSFLVSVLR